MKTNHYVTCLISLVITTTLSTLAADSTQPATQSFDQTDGVLARARAIEDIEYQIMVQRATQAAIYYMPAAVMVDFVKGIQLDSYRRRLLPTVPSLWSGKQDLLQDVDTGRFNQS